jgi:hypothetical protein
MSDFILCHVISCNNDIFVDANLIDLLAQVFFHHVSAI